MPLFGWLFGRGKRPLEACPERHLGEPPTNPAPLAITINAPLESKTEIPAAPVIPAPAASSPTEPTTRALARSLLLSRFLHPASPDIVTGIGYLEADLGESCGAAIQGFIRDGLLVPYSLAPGDLSGAESIFKMAELKEMLRQRGLEVSGRKKEDLFRRLLAADLAGIAAAVSARRYGSTHGLMQCSALGAALANRHNQHRQAMENAVEAALRDGRVESAMLIHSAFEQERPRFSWECSGRPPLSGPCSRDEIVTALTGTPTALLPYSAAEILEARIRVAMALLGVKRIPRFTGEAKPIHTLCMYVAHHRNLESWRESDCVQSVKIVGSEDGPCEECRKLLNRSWSLDDVPELPNPKCTTPGGCRCAVVVDKLRGEP